MTTKVFKTYKKFQNRKDKSANGVSPEFAKRHPNWRAMNKTNEGCWECINCNYCARCTNCTNCTNCAYCTDCTDCYGCSENNNSSFTISGEKLTPPKIEKIHQKVYAAASQQGALNMATWHTCETTHCRAGWVVALAGEEGAKLELKTSTPFAAMMIYKASSDIAVPPSMFYVSNEEALEDMKRCTEEEIKNA